MDRGYLDFARLDRIAKAGAFFVIRAKKGLRSARLFSHPVDFIDHVLGGPTTGGDDPGKLRRIKCYDAKNNRLFVFLTNHFELPVLTISHLYASKSNGSAAGSSKTCGSKPFMAPVTTRSKPRSGSLWHIYVLVATVKKELDLPKSLYEIPQILSAAPFEQEPLQERLVKYYDSNQNSYDSNQWSLWSLRLDTTDTK